jgi:AraC family transcriptional regulator
VHPHVEDKRFHGLELPLRVFSGARAVRVVHPEGQDIEEHRHDWPSLTLHALGDADEMYDGGEARISGPSAVLHPAGRAHADRINAAGLETVSVQFDPAWLRSAGGALHLDQTRCWSGGRVGAASQRLALAWTRQGASECALAQATHDFLMMALRETGETAPTWLSHVSHALEEDSPPSTRAIAGALDLHPAWLARAYRAAVGEGLQDTSRRKRVERAVALLRRTDDAASDIAVAAGFFDQSHMNRGFQQLLGRTPSRVRAERELLTRVVAVA